MILKYIYKDGTKKQISIKLNKKVTDKWINITATDKLDFIKEFIPAFNSGQKIILFDHKHKQLLEFNQKNDINNLNNIEKVNKESKILFFTSGSTGFPLGAFKSKANLFNEVEILKQLLINHEITRVVVTVPFVHIYGIIAGLLLPLSLNNIELIIKDDFLPYEVLEEASKANTLVVTTPVFIKALARLEETKKLNSSIFISSTGPLDTKDILNFESKYATTVLQLFGSTETGGIAYKFGTKQKWTNLDTVNISTLDDKLNVKSSFISKYILDKNILTLKQPFQTEDIIEKYEDGFSIIGRSNKIIKIAGKRISSLQIETILEAIPEVQVAVVQLVYKKDLLRSEQIKITLESKNKVSKSIIKDSISNQFGALTIPFSIFYVDKINYSSVGKKIIF